VSGAAYHSLAAFIAHLRALRSATALNPDERKLLDEMESSLAELAPAERAAVLGDAAEGAEARLRWRAELRLKRLLAATARLVP
jgi:hypothetical protein